MIPDSKLVTLHMPQSVFGESYRALRTNLDYIRIAHQFKTLMITSAVMQSGKSLTIANLGIAMAQAQIRTIIVDADLRRPSQHKIFGVNNLYGLTTAITREDQVSNLYHTGPVEGLYILTSGPLPPSPSELLGSHNFSSLLNQLTSRFDIVLIDAPPVLGLSDSIILGHQSGAVLYLIKPRFNSRRADKKAIELLSQVGSHIVGVVLNQISDPSHSSLTPNYIYS